ncbi:UNVERIFIED_CONTAM: cytochrome C [Euhalothece sp. KZN 001]|uniref:Cytochrome c, mono-and diheme variants family n=2 Tax=Dactylococcopsis salina TaxID=292566 RepID=K9YX84_DACS8|nr:cytochrome c, mono- and diheme variants family [Dactylococcopsis salina PCC 8305]
MIVTCALFFVVAGLVGVYLYQVSDPYVQEVLTAPSNPERGEAIFQINCAGCHGAKGDGNVGPSLHNISERKSKLKLIQQVTSGDTPPMPKFQPKPQDMSDLLGYLETL